MFGDSERVLRLPAFACGLVSLPLFYMAARAYLSSGAALLALAFFALSPSAVYWSANCKQYSSDLTFAIAALILGDWLARHELTRGRAAGAAFLGVVGVFFSFTFVFLLTGLAVGLGVDRTGAPRLAWPVARRRGRGGMGGWVRREPPRLAAVGRHGRLPQSVLGGSVHHIL